MKTKPDQQYETRHHFGRFRLRNVIKTLYLQKSCDKKGKKEKMIKYWLTKL